MFEFSGILFARPSFSEGAARILDFGGTLNEYNRSETGAEADARALRADWNAVADSLRTAISRVSRDEQQAKQTR